MLKFRQYGYNNVSFQTFYVYSLPKWWWSLSTTVLSHQACLGLSPLLHHWLVISVPINQWPKVCFYSILFLPSFVSFVFYRWVRLSSICPSPSNLFYLTWNLQFQNPFQENALFHIFLLLCTYTRIFFYIFTLYYLLQNQHKWNYLNIEQHRTIWNNVKSFNGIIIVFQTFTALWWMLTFCGTVLTYSTW